MLQGAKTLDSVSVVDISTLQVCAKGPGEACGGPYNSAGKCGDGFRRGSNSLIVWMGKHELRLLAFF